MKHREPTSEPRGPGRTFPCLTLLLLPLLSGVSAFAHSQPSGQPALPPQKPYLVAVGSSALRFQEPAQFAEPAVRPPKPHVSPVASSGASADNLAADITTFNETPSSSSTVAASAADESQAADYSEPEAESSRPTRTPRPILQDEMRPQARAEDFLPFFQIPAEHPGDVSVFVPVPHAPAAPPSLPSSSATYTQTPR